MFIDLGSVKDSCLMTRNTKYDNVVAPECLLLLVIMKGELSKFEFHVSAADH